jgi:hypothetical protein
MTPVFGEIHLPHKLTKLTKAPSVSFVSYHGRLILAARGVTRRWPLSSKITWSPQKKSSGERKACKSRWLENCHSGSDMLRFRRTGAPDWPPCSSGLYRWLN